MEERPANDFPNLLPPLGRWSQSLDWSKLSRRVRDLAMMLRDDGPATCLFFGVVLATITAVVVEVYYLNHPGVDTNPDTSSYLNVARDILTYGRFVHTDRTPGYPILLVLFYRVQGGDNLSLISAVQGAFFVVATLEAYVLGLLLFRRPWVAFLIGALAGMDVSQLSFIKPILTESLALFEVMSLVLAVVFFIRRARALTLWIVIVLTLVLFMTRPEWIYLPVPLLAYLMLIAWRRGRLRSLLPHTLAGLVLLYAVLGSYIYVNATQNGLGGVTEIQNIQLVGKVMQYHMQNEAPPEYDSLAQTVNEYVSQGEYNPFAITDNNPQYQLNHYALLGRYATAIIASHPIEFTVDTLPLMVTSVTTYMEPISTIDPQGPFASPLLALERIFIRVVHQWEATCVALALLWLGAALLIRRIPAKWRRQVEMSGAVALLAGYGVLLGALGSFDQYSRLHAPFNPLIVMVSWGSLLIGLLTGATYLLKAYQRRTQVPRSAEPSVTLPQEGPAAVSVAPPIAGGTTSPLWPPASSAWHTGGEGGSWAPTPASGDRAQT